MRGGRLPHYEIQPAAMRDTRRENIRRKHIIVMNKILYWLPRILGIGFVLFISVFSLDVFSEYSGWAIALPLLMHLLPSLLLLGIVILSWKNEVLGGWLFLSAGVLLFALSDFESVIVSLPAIVIGALFLSRKYLPKV